MAADPRKITPYSSFGSYNKFEAKKQEQEDAIQNMKTHMTQHVSKNSPMNQSNSQMTQSVSPQQMQGQMQGGQMQGGQMQGGQMQGGQTRFKHIQSSEYLHNILTNGLGQFRQNFVSKNIQPPPMRILIKLYTDWCGPCKKLGPIMDEISLHPDTKDVIFMKFDAELMIKGQCQFSAKLRELLKISAVPAMFGFIDGKLVGNVFGADMKEITDLIDKLRQ